MDLISYLIIAIFVLAVWLIIGMIWQLLRNFFHNNYSFFDVSFLMTYFLEQFTLILLLEFKPESSALWVGLFALIVVTTASLQKLTMDSRDKELRDLYVIERHMREEGEDFNYELLKENYQLKEQIKKLSEYIKKVNKSLKK